jgi:Zn-dependent peptidase ImmA (M78 family)
MLKRGFKTWCEKAALLYRKDLGIEKQQPLSAFTLAEHLKVRTLTPERILGLGEEDSRILLSEEVDAWSAVTICHGDKHVVIYNPRKPRTRQSNDIMHELSHIILGHKAQMIHSFDAGIFLRTYDKTQEEEADWLAGTLLVNRDALFRIAFSRIPPADAAKEYGVSERLIAMRLNRTGVNAIQRRSTTNRWH